MDDVNLDITSDTAGPL